MPYMAVGSRQILFSDSQAPATAPPVNLQSNEPSDPAVVVDTSTNPVDQEHVGQHVDTRI